MIHATNEETKNVSIHAPVKGATLIGRCWAAENEVSIHAPVKGATTLTLSSLPLLIGFNPRTREGCDLISHSEIIGAIMFQSTHP